VVRAVFLIAELHIL